MPLQQPLHNWARNFTFEAARIHAPADVTQVQEVVAAATKVRTVGTRHSFNRIADSPHDLVSLEFLQKVISLDVAGQTVTIEGGARYGELCTFLHGEGFALANLASLPHLSVAGACATATHGSGDRNGNLATSVCGLEFVRADGELISMTPDSHPETFHGAVVNLGGLGVVTKLTLRIQPTFEIAQRTFENLPFASLKEHFDGVMGSGYSVSLFYDWQTAFVNQVWVKSVGSAPHSSFFGAIPASDHCHPIKGVSAENCTPQMAVPGPWHERLPHFRMEFTPSKGDELQSEYFVARRHAFAALSAVRGLSAEIGRVLHISEVRTIAADQLWMSPCNDLDSVGIHFTWKQNTAEVERLLPRIEEALAPFDARPHWAKLFTMAPARINALYDWLPDFRELLRSHDPEGKFENPYLARTIFGKGRA